jgi:hypothetical protein
MKNLVFHAGKVTGITALSSILVLAGLLLVVQSRVYAIGASRVPLGTAGNYSVLGGTAVVNTGTTTLTAGVGVSPGTISGFGFPSVVGSPPDVDNLAAIQAQSDLATAYSSAFNLTSTSTIAGNLTGIYLPGVYTAGAAISTSGTLTLNGNGDPNAIFVFQINAALNPAGVVVLTNGAQSSSVYWQVNGAVTIGAGSHFVGNILAHGAITVGDTSSLNGRALATGTVTLANDVINTPDIVSFTSTPTGAVTSTTTDSVLATGTHGDSGAITYVSIDGSVCTVNSTNGALTYVGAGACTIEATQAADSADSYTSTSATTSFTVTAPPTDTITFNAEGGSTVATMSGPDGTTITLPVAPTFGGHTFDGWSVASSGGSALTSPYTLAGSSTLFAQWTLNASGGGGTTSPPAVTGITPASGSVSGGTMVTIIGTNFGGATVVDFAAVAAINVIVVNSTTITATSPAGTAGLANVTVTTPGGTSSPSPADTFAYISAGPVILIQGSPASATVTDGGGYSGQRAVTNATGTVSYTETASADSMEVVVSSTGAISAATSLSPGTYSVSGNDSDTNGDTGTWAFALTVTETTLTTPAGTAGNYDLVGSDGGVFVFGQPDTGFYGSLPGIGVHVNDIVGMVSTSDDKGYYLVGSDGGVFAFGDAAFEGSLPGIEVHVNDIVGIVPTIDNGGYFLVGKDGGVFAFGDAPFEGSLPGLGTHVSNIVGLAATNGDGGYWIVGSGGRVYAFGDAFNFGSAPGAVTSITATPKGGGYWLTGADGGVFAFGDAPFEGSLPGMRVKVNNIISMVPTNDGKGYLLVGADGGIFAFGDAQFAGSMPGIGIHVTNIVGAVSTSTGLIQ